MSTPVEKARESVDAQHAAMGQIIAAVERGLSVIDDIETLATANFTCATRRVLIIKSRGLTLLAQP